MGWFDEMRIKWPSAFTVIAEDTRSHKWIRDKAGDRPDAGPMHRSACGLIRFGAESVSERAVECRVCRSPR